MRSLLLAYDEKEFVRISEWLCISTTAASERAGESYLANHLGEHDSDRLQRALC